MVMRSDSNSGADILSPIKTITQLGRMMWGFGSTAAVTVDTTGTVANAFGALNFGITFSVAGTVQAAYTSMQSLN